MCKEHVSAKLEVDFDSNPRHDTGLDLRPGIEQCAEGFSRWADDLQIRCDVKPWKNCNVVKQLRSLLVIETHSPSKGFRNVAAKFEIVIANAKLILLAPGDDSFAAEPEAIELLKRARPRICYSGPEKNPKALGRIELVLK